MGVSQDRLKRLSGAEPGLRAARLEGTKSDDCQLPMPTPRRKPFSCGWFLARGRAIGFMKRGQVAAFVSSRDNASRAEGSNQGPTGNGGTAKAWKPRAESLEFFEKRSHRFA